MNPLSIIWILQIPQENWQKKIELPDSVEAPIKKGDIIGKAVYTLNDNTVGSVNLLASESIPLITLKDTCQQLLHRFFLSEPD